MKFTNTYQKTKYVLTHTGRVLSITAEDIHLIILGMDTYTFHITSTSKLDV